MSAYLEDYEVGKVFEFGKYEFTEENIVEFAEQFDPQPFHTNLKAAQESHFGGLVASGFHTLSAMMGMMVREFIDRETSLGSPGLESIQWLRPVRPGDVLHAQLEITENRRSRSKPDRGVITQDVQLINQDGEVVMRVTGKGMYKSRDAERDV